MDDDEDFSAFMRARWSALVRTLVLLGCGAAEAEDVAQTAMVRCYTAWGRVRGADDVDAYVYRVLLNTWASSRRRRWWGERPSGDVTTTGTTDELASLDLRLSLGRALGHLSDEHRQVLVLRYVADLTETQVAAVLGVAVGTVKSRVSRAIARIDLDDLREVSP